MPMEPSSEMLWDLPVPNSPAEGALENTAKPPFHPDSELPGIRPWYPVSSIPALYQMMECDIPQDSSQASLWR